MEYVTLLFVAFVSATLFPLGSEALLLYDLSINLNIYLLLIVATVGNTLGSVFNYWLGLKGEKYLTDKKIINENKINKAKVTFDKYGGYSLLLSWMPIIGDPITFMAGILNYNKIKFIILVFIAKVGRYIFLTIGYLLI